MLDVLGWLFLLCVVYSALFSGLVSFSNEKFNKINLHAPCCFISVLWLFAPVGS